VYQSFGKSGFGSRRDKFLDIAIAEIAIGKIPKGKRKRSALTVVGFRGFERPTLDHWIREVAKSDLPSVKRGSRESCCGCRFPDREIEELFRVLRASEKGKILC
jgi:hypothetical protein